MKIFLSHTSKDKDIVGEVYKKLDSMSAWYDAADIENGQSIPDKINEGLNNSTHYILFWSKEASKSNWVKAELNSAFIRMMSNKCKFMIFVLDNSELPLLLQPFKYDHVDREKIDEAVKSITEKIIEQGSAKTELAQFVNRTSELGDIEQAVRQGNKLIVLYGILGIGKSSMAEKAIQWLYPNKVRKSIIVDFNGIPGIAELAIELANKTGKKLINDNDSLEYQKENITYFLEWIAEQNLMIILKDVKNWLSEDGTISNDLMLITDIIVKRELLPGVTIMTSSRYIDLPMDYYERTRQIQIKGMDVEHISEILRNNLPQSFSYDEHKNIDFAKRLFGYPLGAKLGAFKIANHGYDFYLDQPIKIRDLKIGLAKDLISYAELSKECIEYLKIVALCQSKLRNDEYCKAFSFLESNIAKISEEAYFAGIVKYGDDGCYKLEVLAEDYVYDLAFNDTKCKDNCRILSQFLLDAVKEPDTTSYYRLIPVTVHILTLTGEIKKASELRRELISTIISSMWDMYNHREYEETSEITKQILEIDENNVDAQYIQALCFIRFEDYEKARKILEQLILGDTDNVGRYNYALGRILKNNGNYEQAIEMFQLATISKKNYLSPHREMSECYMLMNKTDDAKNAIEKAKKIDDSNVFVNLIEARILQKEGNAEKAIELLDKQTTMEKENEQVLFRKGRAYDQLGEPENAKKCYLKALDINSKTYDAKLCLLNHQIIDDPAEAGKEIDLLRPILKGKRRCILTNIEARFIGYFKRDEQAAIELLELVPEKHKDKQWYAVKKNLLENIIEKNNNAGRYILSKEYTKQLEALLEIVNRKFGIIELGETDLLPDA